jgi:uncharacterized protein YehS (DUF1456 family)
VIFNDVLRSVRYMLDLSDAKMAAIFKLAERDMELSEIASLLKKEDEADFTDCGADVLVAFLDGLIIHKRGKMEPRPGQEIKKPERRLTNNAILKKLRVAFELKEEDMHQVLAVAGFDVSKPELSALFRQKGHKNYRTCGDQLLRNFLKGLVIRHRGLPHPSCPSGYNPEVPDKTGHKGEGEEA